MLISGSSDLISIQIPLIQTSHHLLLKVKLQISVSLLFQMMQRAFRESAFLPLNIRDAQYLFPDIIRILTVDRIIRVV